MLSNELQEALAAGNVGALIPKQIDTVLLEYVRRFSPLVTAIESEKWDSDTYFFNQRTALGNGGAVQDGGARPVSNSTYVQNSFKIKLFQSVGAVTGFAQAVTRGVIGDLLQREIQGNTKGLTWDIENAFLWGCAGATVNGLYPTFDGLDVLCNTTSGAAQNTILAANAQLGGVGGNLKLLDQLIDMVWANSAENVENSDWMFVMSPKARTAVGQALTNQQRFMDQVEVKPGLVVGSYRNIPIVESSFLSSRSTATPAVTLGTATTGGTLAAGTHYYRVAAVMARFGELQASAEVSQATTGSTSTVTITLPTVPTIDGQGPIQWKVYSSTSAGTETLTGVVDAYATNGNVATTIVDTGSALLPNNDAASQTAYVGASSAAPLVTNQENIYLISRNRDNILRPYVRDFTVLPLAATTSGPDQLPFAVVTDSTLAVRAPKFLGRVVNALVQDN